MSMRHEGGCAFPVPDYSPGMTLRDWFAGQALAGLMANPFDSDEMTCEDWAEIAYRHADAMLAERDRGQP